MDSVWIWLGIISLILILLLIYLRWLGVVSVRSFTSKVYYTFTMKTKEAYVVLLIVLIIGVAYYCHNHFTSQSGRKKIYTTHGSNMEYDQLRMSRGRGQNMMKSKMRNDLTREELLREDAVHYRNKMKEEAMRKIGAGVQAKPNAGVLAKPNAGNNNVKIEPDFADDDEQDDYDDTTEEDRDKLKLNMDKVKENTQKLAGLLDAKKAKTLNTTQSGEMKKSPDMKTKTLNTTQADDVKKSPEMNESKGNLTKGSPKTACPKVQPSQKFDCHPEVGATEQTCLKRGCCWEKDPARLKSMKPADPKDTQAPSDVPYCFYPPDYPGYTVTEMEATEVGFTYHIKKIDDTSAYYPGDVKHLTMDVIYETENILHVKITDTKNKRYEVPLDVPRANTRASNTQYQVTVSKQGTPFSITVKRARTGTTVFSTQNMAPLMYTDQFLQLSSSLPTPYIFGIGERRGDLLMGTNWTRHTMWTRDQGPREDTNLYGAHPFYQVMEEDGNSHGFFLLNSNAMDVVVQPLPAITWRTIGGILDFYIFMGPTPNYVTRQLTTIVGTPFMPPYWSLGFHICRWGYNNVSQTMEVVEGMRKAGIPQDVQWNDIDYMEERRDFTTDAKRFGDQAGLVKKVHDYGMKYIVIVDPGIQVNLTKGTYKPLDLGLKLDIFLKNNSGKNLIGKVWPGPTVFPDFTHPKSEEYWTTLVSEFIDKIPVDGLWIDMNELSNFGNGSIYGCTNTSYDHPPYVPAVYEGSLYAFTVCPSGKSYISRIYNDHNIYGLKETEATYRALRIKKKLRPFVISRSTFTGQGHFGGHWSGDNHVTFHDLYRSISEILSMNLFAIPMVGADICGFAGNTTYDLCLRWHQLGAFYPFSRNHNDRDNTPQEPFRFDTAFAKTVREVYLLRYSLLPYLYTLFYNSHLYGDTVARPLFQEFPNDKSTYKIETQFLWGSALMIVPVLSKDQTAVKPYLPASCLWYDFYTGLRWSGGQVIMMPAPMDKINLLVRGGRIIPMQKPAQTTSESRKNEFMLLGAYSSQQIGHGSLYWDDGDSLDTYKQKTYNEIQFFMNKTTLFSKILSAGYQTKMLLSTVTLYGVSAKPTGVMVNGQPQQFTYNQQLQVLNISSINPQVNLLREFVVQLVGIPVAPQGSGIKQGFQQNPLPDQGQQGFAGQPMAQGQNGMMAPRQGFQQNPLPGQGQQRFAGQRVDPAGTGMMAPLQGGQLNRGQSQQGLPGQPMAHGQGGMMAPRQGFQQNLLPGQGQGFAGQGRGQDKMMALKQGFQQNGLQGQGLAQRMNPMGNGMMVPRQGFQQNGLQGQGQQGFAGNQGNRFEQRFQGNAISSQRHPGGQMGGDVNRGMMNSQIQPPVIVNNPDQPVRKQQQNLPGQVPRANTQFGQPVKQTSTLNRNLNEKSPQFNQIEGSKKVLSPKQKDNANKLPAEQNPGGFANKIPSVNKIGDQRQDNDQHVGDKIQTKKQDSFADKKASIDKAGDRNNVSPPKQVVNDNKQVDAKINKAQEQNSGDFKEKVQDMNKDKLAKQR